jgi:pSer/pThr/pTyr-binding forkhead associated (FHA) protein
MALTVLVRSGDSKAPPRITFDTPRIVVGRGEGCEVRLPDPSVSHRHASIRQRGTEYIVVDEGSTNGTFVGPVRLSPQAPRVVRSGDLIRVGRIWLELLVEHIVPTQNPNVATREIALGLVADALAAQGEPAGAKVKVVEGPDAARELAIVEFERRYVAGRGQGVDLVLDDVDASRRHVEILRRGSQLYVRDLGSKNGASLGEKKLESGKDTAWPRGVRLHVGQNRMEYEDPVAEALADLERAADEHMREEDSVDPPTADQESAPPPSELESILDEPAHSVAAPIAEVKKQKAKKAPAPVRGGWTMTDVVVALIAITVLGLSLAGLLWLFRAT